MQALADEAESGWRRGSFRQRATAASIAIAIEALIALALFTMSPRLLEPKQVDSDLKTFSPAPEAKHEAAKHPSPRRAVKKQASGGASPAPPSPHPPTTIAKAPVPAITLPGLIPMDLSKADISKIPNRSGDEASAGEGTGKGNDSGSVYGPGEGPGGEKLYDVAWYREPTHAELAGYLPNGAPPGGWAEIACKMIDHYHVENCRSLAESPVGSGLARSMRQAAWQFLVRPPRVGDRVMLGTWVRIRIDFNKAAGGD